MEPAVLILRGHEDAVCCLRYSPDGRHLASGGEDSTVRLWDLAAGGALLATFQYDASIEVLVFRPDGENLVLGSAKGELLPWNTRRKRSGLSEQAHAGGVRSVALT